MHRLISYSERYHATGVEPSILEKLFWWFWDYFVFVIDLIWGFFEPVLSLLFLGIFRVIVILALYVLLFGALIAACHHL